MTIPALCVTFNPTGNGGLRMTQPSLRPLKTVVPRAAGLPIKFPRVNTSPAALGEARYFTGCLLPHGFVVIPHHSSCRRSSGKDQQVDMLRHIDKGQQPKPLLGKGTVKALREQATQRGMSQQGKSMKAGDGQFMTMAWFIEMTHSLSVRSRVEHDRNRKTIPSVVPRAARLPVIIV
jgi:hypothetical protein